MELADKRERLRLYLECEAAILSGAQSYQIGSRLLTRANLAEVRAAISDLLTELHLAEKLKGGRSRRAVFI